MSYTVIRLILLVMLASSIAGGSLMGQTAPQQLPEGIYRFKSKESKVRKVYVQHQKDSLLIYPMLPGKPHTADTTGLLILEDRESSRKGHNDYLLFKWPSFDFGILTILFKYRPKEAEIGRKIETALNGAVYLGCRTEFYSISYNRTPLGNYKRKITDYAFGFGLFSGLGGSLVGPDFTHDQVQVNYKGLISTNGLAANVTLNKITAGLAVGYDYLLDQNSRYWIYQGEPWLGLALSLRLN